MNTENTNQSGRSGLFQHAWAALLLAGVLLAPSASAAWNLTVGETNLDAAIPDNSRAGLMRQINLTDPSLAYIQNLQVRLRIDGEFNGDLYAYLTHRDAAGRSGHAVLLNRVGRTAANSAGSADSGFDIVLTPTGSGSDVHLSHATPSGARLTGAFEPDGRADDPAIVTENTIRRTALLESFIGVDPNGGWTLFLADLAPGSESRLVTWTLEIEAVGGLVAPPDVVTTNDFNACHASAVALGTPLVTFPYVTLSNDAPAQFSVGTTPVVWTAIDTNSQVFTATQNVVVADVQRPTITAPPDLATNVQPGRCGFVGLPLGAPTAADNCGVASLTSNAPAWFPIGQTLVTWTATDLSGNSLTSTQRVTISDFNGTCPADAAQVVRITEFMAANSNSLMDEDGSHPDWIEICNFGANAVNLEGWALTDDATVPVKWRFPDTNLAAGTCMIVFASGKDRAVPGAPLHTSFRLNSAGSYVGLRLADGATVVSEFLYPRQFTDVSYGTGLGPSRTTEFLVPSNVPMKFHIPSAPVAEGWRGGAAFDDSSWSNGAFSAGFNFNTGAVTVAYSAPSNSSGNMAYGGSLGLDFDVVQPVQITELGCFDHLGDGIAAGATVTIELWRRNNGGTPDIPADDTGGFVLASASFTSTSPGTLLGAHRFKPLATPLLLTSGSYTIVSTCPGGGERTANLVFGQSIVTVNNGGGALQFVGRSRYRDAGGYPATADSQVAQYGAGTFKFQTEPEETFATSLTVMHGASADALFRVPFNVCAGMNFATLALNISYDDGFVAWLNGTEIARRNAPDPLAFDSAATNAASATESIDIGAYLSLLTSASTNILAIQGLNISASDGDFQISATLTAERMATNQVYFTTPTPGTANGAGLLFPRLVINELHTDPINSKTYPAEFIELFNPLPATVDLSGWVFTRGVSYVFPLGASIPAGGYLVVAENPAVIQQLFGVTALGPWIGSLDNNGETIELTDAAGTLVDNVSYGLGFPWPTVGDAPGHSMQLLNEGADHDLGGSWRGALPTPGARNSVATSLVPPQIRQMDHSPNRPKSGEIVTVSAKVTDPDGVQSVTLEYQVVQPGSYIRLTDAAFTNNWTSLPMRDDGTGGDALLNDSVFTAQIPASVQTHRRLVRFRVSAGDRLGVSVRAPCADDPTPNLSYFVYDGIPAWTGAVQPGVTPPQTFDTNTMQKVRAYHLISQSNDVWNCQFNGAYSSAGYIFEGALVVDGKVYDHVHYHVAGQNSTYATGKNKWRMRFNRGRWMEFRDNYGRELGTKKETLKWSALTEPWAAWNRGLAGLDEALIFRLANLTGSPAPNSAHFQLRVIDDAVEADPANQYDGDLWGLYLAFEDLDQEFKTEHGLADGNLFRMQGGNNELKAQGAGQPENLSDLYTFVSASTGYNVTPTQPESWWRTNVNLPEYFAWRSVVEAVNHTDVTEQQNVGYFCDPVTGQWSILMWDCDLLYEQFDRWGPNGTQTRGNLEQLRRCLEVPAIQTEFQNRARELQDLLLNSDQAWKLIDEFVASVTDGGVGNPGIVEVDRRRWDYNPAIPIPPRADRAWGNYYRTPFPIPDMNYGPYPQPFYRTLASADFAGQVQWVKDFIATDAHGGARLAALATDTNIPATPIVSYVGAAGCPADYLVFETSAFSSPAGRAFASMQWRIAEVYDPSVPNYEAGTPNRYEIEESWSSGELATFNNQVSIPTGVVQGGHTYRVRAKAKDADGAWSHWSAPVQFVAGTNDVSLVFSALVVTELMHNPPSWNGHPGDELEFLEFKNIGAATLDLSGLAFSNGITFGFTNGTRLTPGQFFVIARNAATFSARYPGVIWNGVYTNKLDNAGERLTLTHGGTNVVFSFIYDDAPPWPVTPDGYGFSLVLAHATSNADLPYAANWRASSYPGGSPGADDPAPPSTPIVAFGPVATNGNFLVTFAGIPGYTYSVLTATNLVGPWTLLRTATAGTNGLLEVTEPMGIPPQPMRFFRTSP